MARRVTGPGGWAGSRATAQGRRAPGARAHPTQDTAQRTRLSRAMSVSTALRTEHRWILLIFTFRF